MFFINVLGCVCHDMMRTEAPNRKCTLHQFLCWHRIIGVLYSKISLLFSRSNRIYLIILEYINSLWWSPFVQQLCTLSLFVLAHATTLTTAKIECIIIRGNLNIIWISIMRINGWQTMKWCNWMFQIHSCIFQQKNAFVVVAGVFRETERLWWCKVLIKVVTHF